MNEALTPDVVALLSDEYFALRTTYESYQEQSLIIKGWSVTVGLSALLLCYRFKPGEEPSALAVALCSLSVVPFFLMDALWKTLQGGYVIRLNEIECMIRPGFEAGCPLPVPLQGFASWPTELSGWSLMYPFSESLRNPTVLLPHVFIILLGILLARYYPPDQIRRG